MRHPIIDCIVGAAAATAAILCAASWAGAAEQCGTRAEIIGALDGQYHETPAEAGSAGQQGGIVELLMSHRNDGKTETWTLILTMPNGQSCLVASGEGWVAAKTDAKPSGTKIDPNAGDSI